jgi:uncharacterized delta-60 repeat protein
MIMPRMLCAASLALTLLMTDPAAARRPGDLDLAFGSDGVAVTSAAIAANSASVVLRQPDGKLVAVGQIASSELTLIRYNPDGTLDPTFGTGGVVVSLLSDNVFAATLQPDGGILVAGTRLDMAMQGMNGPLLLLRFLPDGSIDGQFGNGGAVVFPPPNGQFGQFFDTGSVLIEPDGRPVVSGDSSFASICCTPAANCLPGSDSFIALLRFNPDGSIDPSYGNGGVACTSLTIGGIAAVEPDGAVVVAGHRCTGDPCIDAPVPVVTRYNASGQIDATFGSNGVAPITINPPPQFPGFYFFNIDAVVAQPDGRLLLGITGPSGRAIPVATRLNADGSVDDQFAGGNGAFVAIGDTLGATAHLPSPAGGPTSVALQSDGKIVLVSRPWDNESAALRIGAARFNADGTLDTAYGDSGVVIGPTGGPAGVLVQPDDKLVIAGQGRDFQLVRLLAAPSTDVAIATDRNPSQPGQSVTLTASVTGPSPSGTVQFRDNALAISGCAAVPLGASSGSVAAACSTASLSLGSHVIIATYSGDAMNPGGQSSLLVQIVDPPGSDVVVEYLYPPWNHFFITSLPAEIAALDGGAFPGWQRTGETFAVYPSGAPLSVAQCRFFSGAAFAPKSSHFYTPYPGECEVVYYSESEVWNFEGSVTPVRLPNASGMCPAGAGPLYRAYNNGMGGAPNHRYTTNPATLNTMLAQGWLFEGDANTRVFACVPQ